MLVICPNCLFRFEATLEIKEISCPKCQNTFVNPKLKTSEGFKSQMESEMDDFFKEIELAWEQEGQEKKADEFAPKEEKQKDFPSRDKKSITDQLIPFEEKDIVTEKEDDRTAVTEKPMNELRGRDKSSTALFDKTPEPFLESLKVESENPLDAFESIEIDSKEKKLSDMNQVDFDKAFQIDEVFEKAQQKEQIEEIKQDETEQKSRIDTFFVESGEFERQDVGVSFKDQEIGSGMESIENIPTLAFETKKPGEEGIFPAPVLPDRSVREKKVKKAGISAPVKFIFILILILGAGAAYYLGIFPLSTKKQEISVDNKVKQKSEIIKDSLNEYMLNLDNLETHLKNEDNEATKGKILEIVLKLKERFPEEFARSKRLQELLINFSANHKFQKDELATVLMALTSGKFDEAKSLLDEMLVNNPKDIELRYYYGKVSMHLNQNDVAERYFKAILAENPNFLAAKFFLAKILQKQGDIPKSKTMFEEMLAVDPEHNRAKIELTNILLKEKDIDRAETMVIEALNMAKKNKDPFEEFETRKILASIFAIKKNQDQWVEQLGYLVQLKPDDEDSVLSLSRYYMSIGKLQEAQQMLQACKSKGCRGKEFYEIMLEVTYKLGSEEESNKFLEEAVQIYPDNPKYYFLMGELLKDGGKINDAIKFYIKSITLDPAFTDAYISYSAVMLKLGKSDEAVTKLEQAITKVPSPVPIYEEIGRVYTERGDLKKAEDMFRKLITEDPLNLNYKLKLASLLYSLGRYDEALKLYESSMAKGMLTEEITIQYVHTLIKLHNYKKAEEELQRLLIDDPDSPEVNALLGHVFTEMKELDRGATLLSTALKLDNMNPTVYFYLGLNEIAKGDTGKGIDSLMRAVQLEPENLEFKFRLAKALSETGRKEDLNSSRNHLTAITKEIEKNEAHAAKLSNKADVYYLRGTIYFKESKFSMALKDFEKAVLVDPSRIDLLTTYAKTLFELGIYSEAEAYFIESLQKDKTLADANYYIGMILLRKNKKKEAIEYLLRAIEKDEKNFYHAYKSLGYLYKEKGLKAHTKRYFQLFLKYAPDNDPSIKEIKREMEIL